MRAWLSGERIAIRSLSIAIFVIPGNLSTHIDRTVRKITHLLTKPVTRKGPADIDVGVGRQADLRVILMFNNQKTHRIFSRL